MTHAATHADHSDDTDIFGFWIYILSDCILFASLFAVFAVLQSNVYGGPGIKELSNLSYVLIETMVLLASSFTYGLSILSVYKNAKYRVLFYLGLTFLLGASFVGMEINEFTHLFLEGHTWQSSAALSSFFALVGTHGLHVSIGLLWMLLLMAQLITFGMTPVISRRLTYLGLFWAFLDIIWIFVFTIVYLMGSI